MLLLEEMSEWANGSKNHEHKNSTTVTGADSSTTLITIFLHVTKYQTKKKKKKPRNEESIVAENAWLQTRSF